MQARMTTHKYADADQDIGRLQCLHELRLHVMKTVCGVANCS